MAWSVERFEPRNTQDLVDGAPSGRYEPPVEIARFDDETAAHSFAAERSEVDPDRRFFVRLVEDALPENLDWSSLRERIEAASDQGRLVALIREWFDEGLTEGQALAALKKLRADLRQEERKAEEDRVCDAMDLLGGFCTPDKVLRRPR